MTAEQKTPVILQILPRLETGGVERGTLEIASALKEAGWTSIVVSGGGRLVRDLEKMGTEHITLPAYSKNYFVMRKNALRLAQIIAERNVDIVHARSRAPAWSAKWACEMTGVPLLTTFHGAYNIGPFKIKKKYNKVMTDGVLTIAVSNFIKQHILSNYETVEADKIRVVHRGADAERFDISKVSQERIIALSQKWRLPEDLPVIMLPGRLTRWKGQLVLLEALSKMQHKDLRCLFVGSDQGRKRYRRELERKVKKLGLSGTVQIVDHCSEMDVAYMLSDIVVSASTDPEAFGRVVPEAQAMGRIVIGPNHGGATETIHDGETGFLFEPGNAGDLAQKLDIALSMTPEDKKRMTEKAVASVRSEFSKALMCAKTLDVYREILTNYPARKSHDDDPGA
ncbi:MAG: glycosyltransferase family 4 protein [Alphaproteobacteria bacterium]|nr:glycosyltransferase family 4 protein [Alphaproteobacteria bacterium]